MSTATNHSEGSATAGVRRPAFLTRRLTERRDRASRERLVRRVLAEFREMPCLRLTPAQANRLFGLRSDIGARVIGSLVGAGEIRLDEDGRYAAAAR